MGVVSVFGRKRKSPTSQYDNTEELGQKFGRMIATISTQAHQVHVQSMHSPDR